MGEPLGAPHAASCQGVGSPAAGRTGAGVSVQASSCRAQAYAEALGETARPRSHGDRWTRRITAYVCKQKGNVSFLPMDCDDNDTTHRMRPFQQILTHQRRSSVAMHMIQRAFRTGTPGISKHNKGNLVA